MRAQLMPWLTDWQQTQRTKRPMLIEQVLIKKWEFSIALLVKDGKEILLRELNWLDNVNNHIKKEKDFQLRCNLCNALLSGVTDLVHGQMRFKDFWVHVFVWIETDLPTVFVWPGDLTVLVCFSSSYLI